MTSNSKRIFIFAGEPSGDRHGGHLIHALKEQQPDLNLEGVAGPHMRAKISKALLSWKTSLSWAFLM